MQLSLDTYEMKKLKEVKDICSNGSLELGKIFTEVYSKIGHKGNGRYLKWLKYCGFNQTTAMNHRKRYNLYIISKTNIGKNIIKNSTIEEIDFISSKVGAEFKKIMIEIDKGITKEKIKEIIDNSTIDIKEPRKRISISDLSDIEFLKSISDPKMLARCERKIKEYSKIIDEAQETVKNKKTEIHNKNNLKLDTLK